MRSCVPTSSTGPVRSAASIARSPARRTPAGVCRLARLALLLVLFSPAARASAARSRSGGRPTTATWSRAVSKERWPTPADRSDSKTCSTAGSRRGAARTGKSDGSDSSTLILGSDGWRPIAKPAKDPKADAEFQAALKLFQQGKFAEAEKAVRQDRQGPQGDALGRERPSTTWPRPSISASKYVDAHDSFEKLHADYPATEYLDKLVSREYAIAQLWMLQDDPKAPKDKLLPWYGRFDGRLADHRHARVRPQGPRARPAQRSDRPAGRRRRAPDRRILHEAPRLRIRRAVLRSVHRRVPQEPVPPKGPARGDRRAAKGYLGPEYDASGLEKARDLVRKTMKTFPERQASFEGLYHTLDVINDAEAEKTFLTGTLLQARRQGRVRRVLFRQDPPALAQQPLGRQGQGRAGVSSPRCPERRPSPARS